MPAEEGDDAAVRRLTFSLACLAFLCSLAAYLAGSVFSVSPSGVALILALVS